MKFPRDELDLDDLDTSRSIQFQITDWFIPEADKFREKSEELEKYTIIIYGVLENGYTICTNVINYEPFFYVKPPPDWDDITDLEFNNKMYQLNDIMTDETYPCTFKDNTYNAKIIPKTLAQHFNGLLMVKKKDFWGFTNNKIFRYIKVSVKSLALYNKLKYYFTYRKKDNYKLYESNIDPFLRYIHIQDIKPCGWITIDKFNETDNESRCDYNITTNWNDIHHIDINKIAPLLIVSFDIECTSSHGDFPVPKKDYKKLSQDLAVIAKMGYEYDEDFLINWISNIYINDVIIDKNIKINRVYPKKSVDIDNIKTSISNNSYKIIDILNKISSFSSNSDDDTDDENEKSTKKISVKEQNIEEDRLNSLLSSILPPLKGDKIIQIGTTVHKYGSDDIIYKNIITLDSCDDIEDVDVISCNTEKKLLMEWRNLLIRLNPDIIIGYNIFGFDMEYLWVRAQQNNIIDEFSLGLGRKINRKVQLIKQELSSSAMGQNILNYFDMDGTVVIDLLKVMQRDQKLDSYKLDNVASIFIGDKKDDLTPNEIFNKFKGNSTDRCVIAKYCIQDCALVNRLLHKLKIIENNIGMGNVCLVPLNFLFKRGQGIKIFSLISKLAMDKGFVIPVKNYIKDSLDIDTDGYEGAVVLEPKEGIYLNEPIVVFDYGSLYPSSMIARNLSHDCYIIDKKYMVEDPNIDYMKVCYDIYEGLGDKKTKTGIKECIFAQYKNGKKGIIAEILNTLLQERKKTRKKIEYKTLTLKSGDKVIGFSTLNNDIYDVINIDTNNKISINKNDVIDITDTYNNFEQDVFDALQLAYKITANSLYGQIGARTSPIYLKEIAACTTATGREMIMIAKEFVETNYNADVIYGDSVMPYTPITILNSSNNIEITTFENLNGDWIDYKNFKPNDLDRFNKEQFIPKNLKVWTHKGWSVINRIIRHKTTKKIYRILTHTGLVDVTEDHSLLNSKEEIIKPSDCIIGQELLHSIPETPEILNTEELSYRLGLFDSDGNRKEHIKKGCLRFDTKNQISAQSYCVMLQKLGYKVSINTRKDKPNIIRLKYTKNKLRKNSNSIKKIEVLHEAYDGYVYDIETEQGVFHAGIGNLILKNTDSIFCKFPLKDDEGNLVYGKDSLQYAIDIGKEVEKKIVKIMPSPQKLNYEKSLYPFILLSKKRYVGNLYENSTTKFKQKSMGIVLKRRDNAPIVKKIYGGIIDILLNKQDLEYSVEFLKDCLKDLVNGKTPIEDLIISKTLNSSYKDPTKIAHRVLADRIGDRDAGNKPAINDRIPYVYIKNPNATLQGDRIENPEYIKQNNISPDYLHYITNQIMKPILQIYNLCLDQLPNYDKNDDYWIELENELKNKPLYIDDRRRKNRLANLKLNMVKDLLFQEFIDILKEPILPKSKKPKICKSVSIKDNITTNTIKNDTIDNIKAYIKITKNNKLSTINSIAYLIDNNNKKLWEYKNDKCDSKDNEIINIILMILNIDNIITPIFITINGNKPFLDKYKMILIKYKLFIKNNKNFNISNIIQEGDIGMAKELKEFMIYSKLLNVYDKFKLL